MNQPYKSEGLPHLISETAPFCLGYFLALFCELSLVRQLFLRYGLAAAAVILATAIVAATVTGSSAVTAAAAEDEDKNDYPRTIVTTKVTHLRKPPFLFSSHTMQEAGGVLHYFRILFIFSIQPLTMNIHTVICMSADAK